MKRFWLWFCNFLATNLLTVSSDVFDPAWVAACVDLAEEEGEVDLSSAGLMASGVVGDLDVTDAIFVFAEGAGDLALLTLDVVDVEVVGR